MLTGYTTSVDFKGVTYHVQTEDKGVDTALIVSLVYDGGTVLASKRTRYDDLLAEGFSNDALAKRIRQQHKVMCAAIMTGRLDDLRKLSEKESTGPLSAARLAARQREAVRQRSSSSVKKLSIKVERGIRFKAGEEKRFDVRVLSPGTDEPVKGAQITVKTVGSNFRPHIQHARTDVSGLAEITLKIPEFSSGRGAVVIRAVRDEDEAELRRMIRPS